MTKEFTKKLDRTPRTLLYLCLFLGAFFPGIAYFKDEPLVAQWFISIFVTLIIALYETYRATYKKDDVLSIEISIGQAATIVVACECIYAILCSLLLDRSVQGTMNSSTGLALYISLLLPFVLRNSVFAKGVEKAKVLSVVVIAIITIFATECRTSMLCTVLIIMVAIEFRFRVSIKARFISATIVVILLAFFIFSGYKGGSTNGRWFILKNSIELIAEKPLKGYSETGGFRKVYMEKQAEYFKQNSEDGYAMLADDIKHPLNEFVNVWINYGIVGGLGLVALLMIPLVVFFKKRSFIGICIMVTLVIFSMFSYPFQYPLPSILLLICNVLAFISVIKVRTNCCSRRNIIFVSLSLFIAIQYYLAHHFIRHAQWNKAAYKAVRGESGKMLSQFDELFAYFSDDIYFLYNYMAELYFNGHFKKALEISLVLQKSMSSYNLELLTGDIYMQLGSYDKAIIHFEEASYMCPNRFAPLEGLYKAYDRTGDELNKKRISNIIASKKVKIPSLNVQRIKDTCR